LILNWLRVSTSRRICLKPAAELDFHQRHRRLRKRALTVRPREVMTGQGHPHWLTLHGLGPLQPQRA
jgi:hypothetical protein